MNLMHMFAANSRVLQEPTACGVNCSGVCQPLTAIACANNPWAQAVDGVAKSLLDSSGTGHTVLLTSAGPWFYS